MKYVKNLFRYHCLVLTILLFAGNASPQIFPDGLPLDIERRIDEIFIAYNNSTPGAAVGILQDGEFIYKRSFGMASLEHNIPITSKSVFQIASISKQFTTMAIILLEQEEKLSIDDDIRMYLPEVPDFGATITIRNLGNHTSGLREVGDLLRMIGWRSRDLTTTGDILKMVSMQKELNFEPGSQYIYCNTGFLLLALIVERVSGTPFREFVEERIFKPLEMNDSFVHDNVSDVVNNIAYAYTVRRGGGFGWSIPNFESFGSTSVRTTLEDFAKWERNFRHKKIGGEDGIAKLLTKGKFNNGEENYYAFGIWHEEYRGMKGIRHTGSHAGYRVNFVMYPEYGISTILLGNVTSVDRQGMPNLMADILFEGKLGPRPEQSPPPERPDPPVLTEDQLREFTGTFYSEELDFNFEFSVKNERLILSRKKIGDNTLNSGDKDMFRLGGTTLKFTRNTIGIINGFLASTGRVKNLRFKKK